MQVAVILRQLAMLSHFALLSAVVLIVLLAREASGYVSTRTARFISFENKNRLRAVADVTSGTLCIRSLKMQSH